MQEIDCRQILKRLLNSKSERTVLETLTFVWDRRYGRPVQQQVNLNAELTLEINARITELLNAYREKGARVQGTQATSRRKCLKQCRASIGTNCFCCFRSWNGPSWPECREPGRRRQNPRGTRSACGNLSREVTSER